MTKELRTILSELRSHFHALYGERLADMILYGSMARGDGEPGSDIDVLVVLKGEVNPGEEIRRTSDIVTDLSLRHNVVISCVFMDEHTYSERNGPLLRNIRREGVRL